MLMRTDPFRELDRLAEVLGTPARPAAMPIDAYRKGDTFLVQFDLPGVAADSIDLTVEKNVLTVHATRSRPSPEGIEMLVAERPQGTFSRQLFLGETLDTEHIEAEYTDGVLTLRVPVAESAKPRKVSVKASSNGRTAINTSA
ncbi:MAG: Hsp20/alpha crystallin family protein [Actinomycetota bacterium]|nr:Hsp20/alpha crystallin family protein [Actinomycetota bacterium]